MSNLGLGIRGKLLLLIGIAILVLGGQSFFANRIANGLVGHIDYFGNQRIPLTEAISDMRAATNAAPRYMWLALAYYQNKTERDKFVGKAKESMEQLKKATESSGTYQITDAARAKLTEITEKTVKLNEEINKANSLLEAGDKEAETKEYLMQKLPPAAIATTNSIQDLSTIVSNKNKAVIVETQDEARSSQYMLVLVSVISGALLGVFGFLFANQLAKQLLIITEEVASASTQVAAASDQLSRTSESLSSASQEQASSIEEASASLTEIMGMVEANIRSAESSNGVANQVHGVSEETKNYMESLADAMKTILESNARIEKLVKVIEEIGEKTEVIDDIVFKTQLLSFNASVEAERAGEHGRGFAVVAQEVGNLAQMSGKAATEISSIVKTSIKEAEAVAMENKSRVEKGGELAFETKNKMVEVSRRISEILNGTNQIVIASKEQGQGIHQINESVDNLNKATQETASTAEESSSASAELASQSGTLMDLVGQMRHIVLGTSENSGGHNHQSHSHQHQGHGHEPLSNVLSFKKKTNLPLNGTHNTPVAFGKHKKAIGATDSGKANHLVGGEVPSHNDDAWEKI
jgi:hypothetical protein